MPVSEQIVIRCDYDSCEQLLTVNRNMTDGPLDQAADAILTERSWAKMTATRNGAAETLVYCPAHRAELERYLGSADAVTLP